MLITLKTFQQISGLAYHSEYDSTRGAIEEILGRAPADLSDIREDKALEVVTKLRAKLEILKKDKNYRPPKAVEAKGTNRPKFGLEKAKKKVIMIE